MEDFKKTMNNLHAPEDLLRRTREKMHEENERLKAEEPTPVIEVAARHKTSKRTFSWAQWRSQIIAAAACLVLLVGGVTYYQSSKTVSWNTMPSMNGEMAGDNHNDFEIEETMLGKMKRMYESGEKTKKMEGKDVLLVYDQEADVRYAYWEEEDGSYGWYEGNPGTSEKDFLKNLKAQLK